MSLMEAEMVFEKLEKDYKLKLMMALLTDNVDEILKLRNQVSGLYLEVSDPVTKTMELTFRIENIAEINDIYDPIIQNAISEMVDFLEDADPDDLYDED